jgi:Tol biopolymer transport system component
MAIPDRQKKEDRAILASDTATTNREETLITIGVRYDGQNLGTAASATGAVWSPDGSRFAYITGDGVSVRIGDLSGEESSVLDTGTEWHPMYQWPAWSPDGKLLAAMNVAWCEVGMKVSSVEIIDALNGGSVDRHGPYDFWQADGTLQGPRRLSTPNNISWSREGDKLLVSWDKAVVINVKSGKPRVISSRPVLAEWAPTSDAVYYFEIETGERNKRNRTLGAFYVRRLESGEPDLLLSAEEVANMGLAAEWGPIPGVMSLSPSGSTLAVSGGSDEDGHSELHLFEIPNGSSDVSVKDATRYPVNGRLVALDWAPDESGLAGLVADASGVRLDTFDLATNEWSALTSSGIEVNQVQFLGKVISWSR